MLECLITQDIHLVRILVKSYKERKKDLYMGFINLEMSYNKISREVLGRCFESKNVHVEYIGEINDMHDG